MPGQRRAMNADRDRSSPDLRAARGQRRADQSNTRAVVLPETDVKLGQDDPIAKDRLDSESLMVLQCAAGNTAVVSLLQSRLGPPQWPPAATRGAAEAQPKPCGNVCQPEDVLRVESGVAERREDKPRLPPAGQGRYHVVQRTPAWLRDAPRDAKATQFAESVERRVLSAYGFLVANPSLGAHASLATKDRDGHIELWLKEWGTYKGSTVPWQMFHANAGYAIESLATFLSLSDAPGDTYAKAQVTKGGTRPDLVLYDANTHHEISWLDITARRSLKHVEDKSGPWKQAQNAEILYPSFTDSDFAEMQKNDSDASKPTQMGDDVRLLLATGMTRNEIELEEQELRRKHFVEYYIGELDEKLDEDYRTASQKRLFVVDFFKDELSHDITEKPVAHMLYAAGATVSRYLPKTTSKKVPTGLLKRTGHAKLAELADTLKWPGVKVSDARRKQIRREVEEDLFTSGARTLERSVDLEQGQKRRRDEHSVQPPPLKRARSLL